MKIPITHIHNTSPYLFANSSCDPNLNSHGRQPGGLKHPGGTGVYDPYDGAGY